MIAFTKDSQKIADADVRLRTRADMLRQHGAGPDEIEPLLAYNKNLFTHPQKPPRLPLPDEPFASTWTHYSRLASQASTFRALEPFLPQLRFPVRAGISREPAYVRTVLQGLFSPEETGWDGLGLQAPEACVVEIFPTPAGSLATITAAEREDFECLVQGLGRKNEPVCLPPSMGALMISGYRNWHRIQRITQQHSEAEARQLLQEKANYQDRFILLSRGCYSGLSAAAMGMKQETWRDASHMIRKNHEAAHYFTRRVLGSMRNNIFDEILADFCGLVCAFGRFSARHLLLFLGLEAYPNYRSGARLENYCGDPPFQGRAFEVLCNLVVSAAHNLECFDEAVREANGNSDRTWAPALLALTRFDLEELAYDGCLPSLLEAYEAVCSDYPVNSSMEVS